MNNKEKFAELQSKLYSAGCTVDISQNIGAKFKFPREYDYIVCEYLGKFDSGHLNTHILHIVTRNKNYSLIPILITQFKQTAFEDYRWAIGDSLYKIGYNDTYFYDYVDIVENHNFAESRQMIILLLGKAKQEKCFEIIASLLNIDNIEVLLHTVSALKYYKNKYKTCTGISYLEWILSNEGHSYYIDFMCKRYSYLPYYSVKDAQTAYKNVTNEIYLLLK